MFARVKYLRQIVPHLKKRYGAERAAKIIDTAWKRYEQVCSNHPDEPKSGYMHTRQRIFPAIACFQAMTEAGIERQEAVDFLHDYYLWRAAKKGRMLRNVLKVPGLYRCMPALFRKMTERYFGERADFVTYWNDDAEWDLSFDIARCTYLKRFMAYGCPELCKAFCDADDVCYAQMHPKLEWGRTQCMGKGGEVCDFRIRVRR